MGQKFEKFRLLMWKNWLLQYRKPLQTVIEIAAPILFSILLVILRSLVDPVDNPTQIYKPFDVLPTEKKLDKKDSKLEQFHQGFALVYSPSSNKLLDQSMQMLNLYFKQVKGYKNSKELEAHFLTNEDSYTTAAIQFDDSLYGKNYLPLDLEVSLRFPAELRHLKRSNNESSNKQKGSAIDTLEQIFQIRDWKTNMLYPVFETLGPRDPYHNKGAAPGYFSEGFLTLQMMVTSALAFTQMNRSFIEIIQMKSLQPKIQMQRFPHSKWRNDPLLPALISFIGMLIMLSFVYTCINTVKVITTEKEKQLKEAMKIMGLPNWLHWTAWFTKSFIFLLISTIFITVLVKVPWYSHSNVSIFTYGNSVVIFLFLLFYICATITFCFAISVFFSKANTAAAVAGLLWFLSYTPYMFLQIHYDQLDLSTKLLASLGSNTAMAYGFQVLLMYESSGEGIQWDNIWKPCSPDDDLTLGLVMVMLFVDGFISLIVALYVEAVFPGEYGTPQPWYFPFTYTYWRGLPKYIVVDKFEDTPVLKNDAFEENPDSGIGIRTENLSKKYKKKVAVKNLSFNIYQDQITVLLGHNGAGKTTTIWMLCGIIPPSSGTATVLGYDIRTNMKNIRSHLGFCPQHNILFDDLTVKEHLYFFGKLKGVDESKINDEITKYVQLLDLEPKLNKRVKTLSGGMQRKLCVGIALCGDSKIVLFDEPTAGMDPSSRRHLWNLLQNQKFQRCILLTTHYMDEADLLGDRIAIMADGELKCYGSSFFLKKKFGSGYYLVLDTDPNCEPDRVTEFLRHYIPHAQIHTCGGSEITYSLGGENVSTFTKMLLDLEQEAKNLGIRSYGISLTTLEEVFMKTGLCSSEENVNKPKSRRNYKSKTIDTGLPNKFPSRRFLSGLELIMNQFLAMFMKRLLSIIRSRILLLVQILIPVVFLIIAVVVSRNLNKNKLGDLPKLRISLESYENPVTLVEYDGITPFTEHFYNIMKGYNVTKVQNITNTMLSLTKKPSRVVKKKYLIGASFKGSSSSITTITAWFNNNPYHTPPLILGIILNVVYKWVLSSQHSIKFSNYPLPFTSDNKMKKITTRDNLGFQLAFNIGFSMAFVSSFYILFYVKERVCKSKHLQFTSGVKGYIFWITAFMCDLMTFSLTILAIILTLLCFQEEGYSNARELARVFLLLFYFGFAILPMMYLSSYLFDIPSTGYTRMTLFSVFTGVTIYLAVRILYIPELLLIEVADVLNWICLIFPHYSLATGIRDSYITYATNKICNVFVDKCHIHNPNMTKKHCWHLACTSNYSRLLSQYCCDAQEEYFKWSSPGIGRNLVYSFLTGAILFIIVVTSEYRIFSYVVHTFFPDNSTRRPRRVPNEDEDVFREREKIRNTPEAQLRSDHVLVLKDLTKYYNDFLAVNGLCLAVKQHECFGLLGVNGAGKTSTFKMLTGDLSVTYGEAWINNFSIRTEMGEVHKVIGYCPQFDALLPELTAEETLTIFALLRGISMKECKQVSEKLAQYFNFQQHLHKMVKQLSGGNKRKLSTALSLVGDPAFICLDEPTAGMDPATKRHLWNALCTVRDSGKCILFTSHSMEECEALCTKLAIMVNGNFQCLGSIQHLKNKFVAGFTLQIKIKRTAKISEEIRKIEDFVKKHFPTATQQEKHKELISYHIVDDRVRWWQMFEILEEAKGQLNIEDYSVAQASLEQVFLKLTTEQL